MLVLPACNKQAEGQRCDILNGDDDCDTSAGLVCRRTNQPVSGSAYCCPSTGASTHQECQATASSSDTGVADTGSVTTGTDASVAEETAPEASSEAAVGEVADTGSDATLQETDATLQETDATLQETDGD